MSRPAAALSVLTVCALLGASAAAAGEIRGRLLVEEQPAAGLTVSAVPYESPLEEARREARRAPEPGPLATATSGADGSFVLPLALPASAAPAGIRLVVRGSGVVPTISADVYGAAETADVGDWTLPRSGRLAGRVVNARGAPVAGAEVRLDSSLAGLLAGTGDVLALPRTTLSAADGSFRFDDAAPTSNRLRAEASGYAPVEATGVREGALARPLTLEAATALSGTVTGVDGQPARGALVRFEGKASSRWAETGADGGFRLTELPGGNGILAVDAGEAGAAEVRGLELPASDPQPLRVRLAPAAAIEGQVLDASSGRALPRVKVTLRDGQAPRVTRSGADGLYRIAGLGPGRYRLEADEPRYVPYVRSGITLLPGATEKADLPLVVGAALSGQVVDEDGRPIEGARGRLALGGETGLAAFVREGRTGDRFAFRSGADGTFEATRLQPGDNQRLTVTHPEHERQTVGGLSLAPGATRSGVRVVMRRGLSLVGFVKDEEGNPVAGAEVSLVQMREFRAGRRGMTAAFAFVGGPESRPRTQSGPDGRFEFKGLGAGAEFTIGAEKPGYADGSLSNVRVAEGMEPVEVRLGPAALVSGRVVDSNGTPLEGFMVQARPRGGGTPGMGALRGGRERTGADGVFLIEGLRDGEAYDLVSFGPGDLGPTRENVVAPADGIELAVPARGRITGRVTDAQSGAPVVDFEVSYEPDRSGSGMRVVVRAGPGRRGGAFSKEPIHSEDGSFALEDVAPGTWQVAVEAPGYEDGRVGGIVVESGRAKDVEVKLSRGRVIRGRVVDAASGRGVPGASVSAEPSAGAGGFGRSLFVLGQDLGIASDADGLFEIDGLAAGKYVVKAQHPDYSEATHLVEVAEVVATAELRLSAGGSLGGQVVTETRRPLPGAEVVLSPAGEGMGRGFPGMGGQAAVADEAGRFRFDHLAAGRYTLVASVRERASAPVDVALQAGEAREDVVLALEAGATVRGFVSGLPDEQRGGINVSVNGSESYFASGRTSGDGSFEFVGVPAGPATLRATAGDFLTGSMRSASAEVNVPEGGGEVQADLLFETGFTLSGTLLRGTSPVADAFVNASRRGSGRFASARSDASGSFRLEGLDAGTYTILASSPAGGSVNREVEVDGDTTLELVIPVARLAGMIVEAGSRQPLADAAVQIEEEAGASGPRMMRMSVSDSAGRFALEDLEPRGYRVTARKPGYEAETRQLQASETVSDDLVLELRRGEGVSLQVRDGIFGVPLRGVMVRASDASGATAFNGSVSLDSEGRGEIPSLRAGRYTVVLDASGYAATTLTLDAPAPLVAVAMTPGGTIEVRAGATTLATGRAEFQLLTATGAPAALWAFDTSGRVVVSRPLTRLENVAPGRYTLVPQGGGGTAREVIVAEGGVAVVELP